MVIKIKKKYLLLIFFLISLGINVFGQKKEDFELITFFKDTLVTGISNTVHIKTKLNIKSLTLYSDKLFINSDKFANTYEIRVRYPSEKTEITLSYYVNKKVKTFTYPFTVVPLSLPLINRQRIAEGLSPIIEESKTEELKIEEPQKTEGLSLIVPNALPEYFDPILVSKNKRYAYLGNRETKLQSVLDLKSHKLILAGRTDSLLDTYDFYESKAVLSNTGRYLYNGFDNEYKDGYIQFSDLFQKKYLVHHFPLNEKYSSVEMEEFSSDDENFLSIAKTTAETEWLLYTNTVNSNYVEFKARGTYITTAAFMEGDSTAVMISHDVKAQIRLKTGKETKDDLSKTVYIDKVIIDARLVKVIDSIIIPIESEVKIEHGIMWISYYDPTKKSTVFMLYDLKIQKIISTIEVNEEFITHKNSLPFISIHPDAQIALIGKMNNNESEFYLHDIRNKHTSQGQHRTFFTASKSRFIPVLLENETVFAVKQNRVTYLDEPEEQLFWYNVTYNIGEQYVPQPLLDVDDWIDSYNCNCSDTSKKSNRMEINFQVMKNRGKPKWEIITKEVKPLNHTTIRFGTYIKETSGFVLYNSICELNVAKLHFKTLMSFPRFTSSVKSNDFELGENNYTCDDWDLKDSLVKKEIGPLNKLLEIKDENRMIYTTQQQNSLLFYNANKEKEKERVVNFVLLKSEEWIYYTSDLYYACNFKSDPFFQYSLNGKPFPFEQFDLKYNRPDIILERLGYSDSTTIASYHNAYKKRLKRLGFTEDMLKEDLQLPEIKIRNFEHLPAITDSSGLNLEINLKDSKYKLDRINIFINDVPVFGTAGIDLRKEETKEMDKEIKLILAEGENKIQVSLLNQAGVESYKETAYITYQPKTTIKPDLYLITIGDSKYKDNRYDLRYASKDALDIKSAFESNHTIYGKILSYNYVDEKVTRENILKLKEELKLAKRDDVVMIVVAGHGVLDNDLNYYLATYDMDFSNPSVNGLLYDEVEALVDGIAPLKKIIFLDACHSGEVDKEEVDLLAANIPTVKGVKFRNVGVGVQKKNLGLKTTSELMGELFTDLRKGTGATVISSAGGAEYAMESDQWKNGLFTYCLLHGLKDKAADANKDGQIMLSELQQYLRTEVTKLSNGAQQPTSRIENLSMDFRIW